MITRLITVLFLVALVCSCKGMPDEHAKEAKPSASPVLESLRESGLPCFKCHTYEKFAVEERGAFSHNKHMGFEIHCNHCHVIKAHKESTIKRDACNSCHKIGSFTYAASGIPVEFSHQVHAGRFNCSECHPKNFNMKKGTTHITMQDMDNGQNCGKCHNGKVSFSTAECARCHEMKAFEKELSYPSGGVSPAIFGHKIHTAMFGCSDCHSSLFKYRKNASGIKMDEIYKGKFCGKCHNEQTAFGPMACQKCHQ